MTLPQFVPKGIVYRDDADKLRLETRNGVIEAEFIFHKVSTWPNAQKIGPDLLLELQRLAVNQIYRCAGNFRDDRVILGGADHKPPHYSQIPSLVDEMVENINGRWQNEPATRLAAYAMWRVNWIHPFFGGNGRTARAFSYLILCLRLGFAPPAEEKNIPELIVEDRVPYYVALRAVDAAWSSGVPDLSAMEELISSLLAKQLTDIHFRATGKPMPQI